MAIDPVTAVLDIGGKLIDRLWPNPAERDAAKLALYKAQQEGQFKEQEQVFQLAKAQIEVNKEEAASTSLFVSGWRPAVGWTCVFGLVYSFVAQPLLSWSSNIWVVPVPPELDMGTLLTLLAGMLGLGSLRTYEKKLGVDNK